MFKIKYKLKEDKTIYRCPVTIIDSNESFTEYVLLDGDNHIMFTKFNASGMWWIQNKFTGDPHSLHDMLEWAEIYKGRMFKRR